EIDVLAAMGGVRAGDARLGALAAEPGLHPHAATRGSEPERDPVQRGVPAELRPLRAEDPALLRERLAADVAQMRVGADRELGDDVEHAVEVRRSREVLLPDLG